MTRLHGSNSLCKELRFRPIAMWLSGLLIFGHHAEAREYFNPAFLGKDAGVDLSAFERLGYIPPGRYPVDIYMNKNKVETRSLNFREHQGNTVPELTLSQLNDWGVNVKGIAAIQGKPMDTVVSDLPALIPQSAVTFDFSHLRLDVSIPQASMQPSVRDRVDPSLWDEGIPVLLMNYNVNGSKGVYDNLSGRSNTQNLFATFRNGINAGPWRLRSTQTYTWTHTHYGNGVSDDASRRQWHASDTYLQRDVQFLRGELTAGESSTGGEVFDGIPFRGVQLVSDNAMLPDSMQGYAPVITGTANSNALVTVTQNGYTVYQTTVAPGPFRITDMYAAGNSGDLTVTVREADGTTHVSRQAYSTLPIMQRSGGARYEVTLGQYYGGNVTDGARSSTFGMATLVYGLPHNVTAYGGGLLASHYQSAVVGTGVSLGVIGAMSMDVTLSRAQLPGMGAHTDAWKTGQSYRVRFSKDLMATGTGIDLAAYRYSTQDYYSFSDINSMGYPLSDGQVPWALGRRRSTMQVNLRQSVGRLGSLYLSASQTRYWEGGRTDTNLSSGYNMMIKGVSVGLNYSIDRIKKFGEYPQNRQLSLNMQIPFSLFGPQQALQNINASYGMTHDGQGRVNQTTGVNGILLDNRLSWGAQQSWGNANQQPASSFYLGYQGSNGNASVGYSQSGTYKNYNYGVSGGVLVHQHGVTLARNLSDGAVLVRAPGVSGATVSNGIQTDWRGYAVVPAVTPYRRNSISIDPSTLPDGADIEQTSQSLYPTRGAVVMADYHVRIGGQLLMTLLRNGLPLPFGATVSLVGSDIQATGIIGDGGRVYLTGMPPKGRLQAKWGNTPEQQCRASYHVRDNASALTQLTAQCQ
ncbi:fimbrial biogenesis outer membrane usher protein [Serratia marcescens]|uniref:Fimbrial biogenesis outer membrane usher protein n=1 Tax=Serratia marcescens TaxID=615 RepID=A0A5C7BRI7_SERMA|nr:MULTISPECIES: fimbria/pilus outer membrane usher protein [Serratia]TXE24852.1 fimbrial biogenesis outer membrane usher protein [Serratia marcescens]TXE53358.1 fimbrial biogenesis outer membrane usher protein [Serratia marcescens]